MKEQLILHPLAIEKREKILYCMVMYINMKKDV